MESYKNEGRPIFRVIAFILFLLVFAGDLVLLKLGLTGYIDDIVTKYVMIVRDSTLTLIMKGISFMANTTTLLGLCLLLIILPTRMKFGFPVGISTGLAALVHHLVKNIIERPRPPMADRLVEIGGWSFPSGHANAGAVFYLFLMALLCRYFLINGRRFPAVICCIIFPLLVIAIGVSRVYLGVHYATDVIAGWSMGICLLVIFYSLYEYFYPLKYRFTYNQPAWGEMKRRHPWKIPHAHVDEADMIQFPKNRAPWRKPKQIKRRDRRERTELREQQDKGE